MKTDVKNDDAAPDEAYIRMAIELAHKSEQTGGIPIGALLVKDGEVISQALSLPWSERDTTNHTEIDCIRAAAKEHGLKDLTGCTLYGVIEPCSMCLSACLWAGVSRVVFGAYASDISANPYEYDNYSSEELVKNASNPIRLTGSVLREECAALLKDYKDWQKQ